jgi:hypothetical protein
MGDRQNLDEFIEEAKGRQRNIVFPDTVRNGRAVDVFFWRGSPAPTLVQRIAAWMFGLLILCNGLTFFGYGCKRPQRRLVNLRIFIAAIYLDGDKGNPQRIP